MQPIRHSLDAHPAGGARRTGPFLASRRSCPLGSAAPGAFEAAAAASAAAANTANSAAAGPNPFLLHSWLPQAAFDDGVGPGSQAAEGPAASAGAHPSGTHPDVCVDLAALRLLARAAAESAGGWEEAAAATELQRRGSGDSVRHGDDSGGMYSFASE